MAFATAYIGIGANLGEARQSVLDALTELSATSGIIECEASTLYGSDPVEATGPQFVNAVAQVHTTLSPLNLLDALQAIEARHGRTRLYRNAPRTLDLDLLWYDGLEINTPRLTLPHPRMHQRAFVLLPLKELAPGLVLSQGDLDSLCAECADQKLWKLQGD